MLEVLNDFQLKESLFNILATVHMITCYNFTLETEIFMWCWAKDQKFLQNMVTNKQRLLRSREYKGISINSGMICGVLKHHTTEWNSLGWPSPI